MKPERFPEPEKKLPLASERMEEGVLLSTTEKEALSSLLERQAKYGMPMTVDNFDRHSGKQLDVWDNLFKWYQDSDQVVGYLQQLLEAREFAHLTKEQKEEYIARGVSKEMEKIQNVKELSDSELEILLLAADWQRAEKAIGDGGGIHPLTGEKVPRKEENFNAHVEALRQLSDYYTSDRQALQKAAKFQILHNLFVPQFFGDKGAEYWERVRAKAKAKAAGKE
ncbi:MAG: hypothetical protein AAB646_00380 [Patescibacteria group bacterium]